MRDNKPEVTASVDKAKSGGEGELREIRIEPANNGFMLEVRRKPTRTVNKSEPYDYDASTERNVFADSASLAAYLVKTLGKKK